MKYCKTTTQNHPVSLAHKICLEDINTLIIEEGYSETNPLFTNNEIVINLDKAKKIIAKSKGINEEKSVDMAFGLTHGDSSTNEMLMVELKFNYVNNLKNLKMDSLKGKIRDSKNLLTELVPISNEYIFIFKTNHIEEAKNKFFRAGFARNFIVMDISKLKEIYF